MKNEELKAGDIMFVYTANDLFGEVQRLVDQPIGHCAILNYLIRDAGMIKCSVIEETKDGLKQNIYDIASMKNVAVGRYRSTIDHIKMQNVIWSIYTDMVQTGNKEYSYMGLADAAVNAVLEYLTFDAWKKHRLFPGEKKAFCSEFVALCYSKYGLDIAGESDEVVSPTDIYRLKQFEILKGFEL